jgi:hypothetical protein
MSRAAIASSWVRSGICDPPKGSGMSKPSPVRRGMRRLHVDDAFRDSQQLQHPEPSRLPQQLALPV